MPTDTLQTLDIQTTQTITDLINQALSSRPELLESDVDLQNRQITRKAAKNALLPALTLVGFYGGTGLAGEPNPLFQGANPSSPPPILAERWRPHSTTRLRIITSASI